MSDYKGITLKIGADVSPMNKALKDSEKESKNLQNELKQIERLLKLDPKNTELLAQKQQLLSQAVQTTKVRLDALRQAQEKVNKAHDANASWEKQYAPLKKAIQDTSKEMNDLAKQERELKQGFAAGSIPASQYNAVKKALDETTAKHKELKQAERDLEKQFSDGHISDQQYRTFQRTVAQTEQDLKSLREESKRAKKSLEDSAAGADTFGGKLIKVTEKATDTKNAVGNGLTKAIDGFGIAAAVAGVAAGKAFIDFGEEAIKVRTLLDETVLSFDDARQEILRWSDDTGLAADNVATAMYDALSAEVSTADVTQFMGKATQLAVAGFTDAGTSVDILTTILNSYGMSVDQVTKISDELLVAQDKGKVTVGEFSQGLGDLVGIAANAGVSLEEVLSAVATLTASGLKPSSAITSLKAAISNMIKPTEQASEQAKKLHMGFNSATLSSQGLAQMMDTLSSRTGGNTAKMAQLFGSTEALNAMMVLTSKDGNKSFKESLESMNHSLGTTEQKFNMIASDPSFKFNQSVQQMKNSLIQLGISLTPLINAVSSLLTVISKIPTPALMIIGMLLTMAPLMMKMGTLFGNLAGMGGKVGGFFTSINPAMLKTVGIIMIVAAALITILALIAALSGKANDVNRITGSISGSVGEIQQATYGAGVPKYANGTNYHMGGRAVINEYGPELLDLPAGTKVRTVGSTRRMLGQEPAAQTIYYVNIDAKNVKEFNDIVRISKNQRQTVRAKGG